MPFDTKKFFQTLSGTATNYEAERLELERQRTEATTRTARQAQEALYKQEYEGELVQKALQQGYSKDPETGQETLDYTKSRNWLEANRGGHLASQLGEEHKKGLANIQARASAPFKQMASDWTLIAQVHDTNKEVALKAIQRQVQSATDYKFDDKSQTLHISTPNGIVSTTIDDMLNYARTSEQQVALRSKEAEAEATRAEPSKLKKQWLEAVSDYEDKGQPIPETHKTLGAYQIFSRAAGAGFMPGDVTHKAIIAANQKDLERTQKENMEAQKSVPYLNQLLNLLESGVMDIGPGQRTQFALEKMAAAANRLLGTDFEVDPTLGFQENFHKLSQKIAYANRAAFMPGPLSDNEGNKLEGMEVGLATTREGARLVLRNAIENKKFQNYIAGQMPTFMRRSDGLNAVGPDGHLIPMTILTAEGKKIPMHFDNWREYVDTQQTEFFKRQSARLEKHIFDTYGMTPEQFNISRQPGADAPEGHIRLNDGTIVPLQ